LGQVLSVSAVREDIKIMDYKNYLNSLEWKTTRFIKLNRKGKLKKRCAFCSKKCRGYWNTLQWLQKKKAAKTGELGL
jgi:hypothetical protein